MLLVDYCTLCCNLTDHRGLPIMHIKSIRTQQRQETRTQMQNNRLYYIKRLHTNTELNQVLIWLNSLIYMIYKQLHITSYRFGQPTGPYAADLISNQSTYQLAPPTSPPQTKLFFLPNKQGRYSKLFFCLRQLFSCLYFMGYEVGWLVVSVYILQQLLLL